MAKLWKSLKHSAWVILLLSLATTMLAWLGAFDHLEMGKLDAWQRLKAPQLSRYVTIVAINDADFKGQFEGKSPLSRMHLMAILQAIAAAQPAVIGIDIDTSEWPADAVKELPQTVPMVWARDAELKEVPSQTIEGASLPRALWLVMFAKPAFSSLPVLGGAVLRPPFTSGIALIPEDSDAIVRRYDRTLPAPGEPVATFHWAVVKTFCESQPSLSPKCPEIRRAAAAEGTESSEQFIMNWAGGRTTLATHSAADVLLGSKGAAWHEQSDLKQQIVLVGGEFRASRDLHDTPFGRMYGVEVWGQAVESELGKGGVTPANEILMFFLEVLCGIALVAIAAFLRPGRALMVSLLAIPLLAFAASFFVFSAIGLWMSFVPMLIGILLHELWDHAREYRHLLAAAEARSPVPKHEA